MNPIQAVKKVVQLGRKYRDRKRAIENVLRMQRQRPARPQNHAVIGVYFADSATNLYQLRQWYLPLQRIAQTWPVLILSRNATAAEALMSESELDVAYAPKVTDLEQLVRDQPLKMIFYVNQNTRNFQMMRYGSRWHVFINHGESDKMYMTTNQIKSYDYALVAGAAARERLSKNVWHYDVSERTIEIGRPQNDYLDSRPPYPNDDRIVVLYSPTWEGDRAAAAYGSVVSHGVRLAEAVLSSPRHRLVYRPHPRTGVENPEFHEANMRIIQSIVSANREDSAACHIFDDAPAIDWQLSRTDIAICDISAMIYDRLATGKPVLVTRPAAKEAIVDTNGYLGACEWLTETDAPDILKITDRVLRDKETQDAVSYWSERYFGDTRHGEPSKRFENAIHRLLERWESEHFTHSNREV